MKAAIQAQLWPDSELGIRSEGEHGASVGITRAEGEGGTGEAERSRCSSLRKETKAVGSFGERMQREREMRSIRLDEIAESTKISTRMLRALEEEEFEKLPGGIFNKGFVRAYSRYLGLDEEQAVADYLSAEAEREQKSRESSNQDQAQLFSQANTRSDNVYNIRASAESVDEKQPDQAAGFMTAAVILVILLGMGGFAWKYVGSRSIASAAKAPQISQPAATPPAQPTQTEAPPPSLTTTTTTAAAASVPAAEDSRAATKTAVPEKTESQHSATSDIAVNQSPAPELEKDSLVADPAKFSLEIRATEQSWVQVKADGTNAWTGVLTANSNKSFRATKELVIKLGNASGVELSYNGKPLPRFNSDTKIKTLTFTPEGLSSR